MYIGPALTVEPTGKRQCVVFASIVNA